MNITKYFAVRLESDVERTHGLSVSFGDRRGVNFSVQWRSYQPTQDTVEDHVEGKNYYDPMMLSFNVFVWGTFLGANPHGMGFWDRKCCSNGITLFHWTAIESADVDHPYLMRRAGKLTWAQIYRNPTRRWS